MTSITKKLERARDILAKYEMLEKFSAEHVAELSDLTGAKLSNVCKARCPRSGRTDIFLVVTYEGSDTREYGFSWNKRIRGKHGDPSARVNDVLRRTISHQLMSFREQAVQQCFFCGSDKHELHVDHAWPTFSVIRDDWVSKSGYPKLKKSADGCGHVFECRDAERSWQKHHHESVSLQMLCKPCNLKKSDNDSLAMSALWIIALLSKQHEETDVSGILNTLMTIGSMLLPTDDIYKEYT